MPLRHGLHEADVWCLGREIRDEQAAGWRQEFEHPRRERGRYRPVEIVEEPGRVDKVEPLASEAPGQDFPDRAASRSDAGTIGRSHHRQARLVLVEGHDLARPRMRRHESQFTQVSRSEGQDAAGPLRPACPGKGISQHREPVSHGAGSRSLDEEAVHPTRVV